MVEQLWVNCDFFFRINFPNFLPSILYWFLPLWPFITFSFSCFRMHLSLRPQLPFLCLYPALLNVLRYPYSTPVPSLCCLFSPGAIPCPGDKSLSFFPLPVFPLFSADYLFYVFELQRFNLNDDPAAKKFWELLEGPISIISKIHWQRDKKQGWGNIVWSQSGTGLTAISDCSECYHQAIVSLCFGSSK